MSTHQSASVEVIDCTLRDGEQAAGVWFSVQEKLELAIALDAMGVNTLDAGFPANGGEEIESLQELRQLGLCARVGATARPVAADIRAAALARAEDVFLVFPVSDQHLQSRVHVERRHVGSILRGGVEQACGLGMVPSVVLEDAMRADLPWLLELVGSLSDLPVLRWVVCDTVGVGAPARVQQLFAAIARVVRGEVKLASHCHNDFGLATANTLASVEGGASSVSCTINGLGERAGNADLAEVSAGLEHLLKRPTTIRPKMLPLVAEMVDRINGIHTSPTKPITGSNAYAHESGIHVDGVLKASRNYEALPPEWSGQESRVVLGKHSGSAAVRHALNAGGLDCADEDLAELVDQVHAASRRRSKETHVMAHGRMLHDRQQMLNGVTTSQLQLLLEARTPKRARTGS